MVQPSGFLTLLVRCKKNFSSVRPCFFSRWDGVKLNGNCVGGGGKESSEKKKIFRQTEQRVELVYADLVYANGRE